MDITQGKLILSILLVLSCLTSTDSYADPQNDNSPKSPQINEINEQEASVLLQHQIQTYLNEIETQEILGGTYDLALSESLSGMAKALQANNDHPAAILAYQQSMHIQRVNNGIYSLSQEPMVRGMITSYQALNDLNNTSNNYQQLHWLYTKVYGENDPHLIPLLKETSEWHLLAYNYNKKGLHHLASAHRLIAEALSIKDPHHGQSNLSVIPLLHGLVITNYQLADYQRRYLKGPQPEFSFTTARDNTFAPEQLSKDEILIINSFRSGRIALENIINTVYSKPESSTQDKALALTELGDWYLLFGYTNSAYKAYSNAWQVLEHDQGALNAFFGEPLFIPLQTIRVKEPLPSGSYFIARLSINRLGKTKSPEILEIYPSDHQKLARSVIKELKLSRFRPRIIDGKAVASNDIIYTHYFND